MEKINYENNNKNNNKINNDTPLFPGKIAVISDAASVNEDTYSSAEYLVKKYGKDRIVHIVLPVDFIAEREREVDTIASLAEDREVRALIITQTIPGTNEAVDRLKEKRDDIFIICCSVHESLPETAKRVNLIMRYNALGMGAAMVKQAKKQGARAFVFYSFPRHMMITGDAALKVMVEQTCKEENIEFVYAEAPDPADKDTGIPKARQFILDDVPKLVAKYGEDTAFYCSNCHLQASLIKAVVDRHAIFPQPCCPSPFHGFPEALGIETDGRQTDLNYVISEASRIAAEKYMTDRLSTWPISAPTMFTSAGAEYAIMWINGQAPKTGIEVRVLEESFKNYIKEVVGESVEVEMTSYSENGIDYNNVKLILMSYLDL